MLIDTHCHLGFDTLFPRIDEILESARANNVNKFITIGCEENSWDRTIEIVDKYPDVFGALGLHPHEAAKWNPEVEARLKSLLTKSSKLKALGEIGLDYFYLDKTKETEPQIEIEKNVFTAQLELARELNLPVIIHTRDAEADTLDILKNFTDLKVVIHCFSGTKEFALKMIDLGFYISFTGIITFNKSADLRSTLQSLPLDRIMIETDSPYLAPEPNRGKVNEPMYLKYTFDKVCEVTNRNSEELAAILEENSCRFFNI